MSVIFQKEHCCIVDHWLFIEKIYRNVLSKEGTNNYRLKQKLFVILNTKSKNNEENSRKRKVNEYIQDEAMQIKYVFKQFIQNIPEDIKTGLKKDVCDISAIRNLARDLFRRTAYANILAFGGNDSNHCCLIKYSNEDFLIPPNCRFLCGPVDEQCQKILGKKFNSIIIDPPWWNKYIRRLKKADKCLSYSMMYNEEIAALPIKNLMANNCIIVVWCTNAESNIDAVKKLMFPQWGVEYVSTWYWLKVTVDLEPLCKFGAGSQKQPYERLIIGKVGEIKDLPENKLIVSVPSALHSHKPPLSDIIAPYLDVDNPQTLELFARYLLPNTTSVGYEPLKWQHLSLYDVT